MIETAMMEAVTERPNIGTDILSPYDDRSSPPEWSELRRKWGVYSPGELKQHCSQARNDGFVIEGIFPERAIAIVVGDSGIGKSPFIYQAALCVAAGIPFLGHKTQQGPVLYADFENGLGDVDELITKLAGHLGLEKLPDDLVLWNVNECPSNWREKGGIEQMIREIQPRLAVIDSLSACYPKVEDKNSSATEVLQSFRAVAKDCGTTIASIHHLRKPSNDPKHAMTALEKADNPRDWFKQVRGASALINGTDIRLGIAAPASYGTVTTRDGQKEEIALVCRGFGRIRGEIPTTYFSRVMDEEGNALGYHRLSGAALLFNPQQEGVFVKLPEKFRFKEAQAAYERGGQATTDLLTKCINAGILGKLPNGKGYEKVKRAE